MEELSPTAQLEARRSFPLLLLLLLLLLFGTYATLLPGGRVDLPQKRPVGRWWSVARSLATASLCVIPPLALVRWVSSSSSSSAADLLVGVSGFSVLRDVDDGGEDGSMVMAWWRWRWHDDWHALTVLVFAFMGWCRLSLLR